MEKISLGDIIILGVIIISIIIYSIISCYVNMKESQPKEIESNYIQFEYL